MVLDCHFQLRQSNCYPTSPSPWFQHYTGQQIVQRRDHWKMRDETNHHPNLLLEAFHGLQQSVGKPNESKAVSMSWGERDWRLGGPRQLESVRQSTGEEGTCLGRAPKMYVALPSTLWLDTKLRLHRVKRIGLDTQKLPETLTLYFSALVLPFQSLVDP